MKTQITFTDLTIEEAQHVTNSVAGTSLINVSGPSPEEVIARIEAYKPKRKRRTKGEMAEARAAETDAAQEAAATISGDPPVEEPPRRRKQRGAPVDAGPEVAEANLARGRKQRGARTADPTAPSSPAERKKPRSSSTTKSPSEADPTLAPGGRHTSRTSTTRSPSDDDISDTDLSRKASEGAQDLTPAVVTAILEEFGVAVVNDLDQEQRREFVNMVESRIQGNNPADPEPELASARKRKKRGG